METFDNNIRNASRRSSLRRGSLSVVQSRKSTEVPWDILERLLMPLLFCHAAAIILSTFLNVLHISSISTATVFIWLAICTVATILFFHFIKVSSSGKGVLITGCESPIAWYLAKKLDDVGFTVYAGFTNSPDNSEEGKVLKEETSGRLHILHLDITSEKRLLEAALFITEHMPHGASGAGAGGGGGGLWAVVHCAQWMALGELEWIPFGVLRKSMDLNLLGVARLTQLMLPLIRKTNGRIIFLTSGLCKVPTPVRGIQCATQAAVESFAACLRQEMKPRNVAISVVATGEFAPGNAWLNETELREQAKLMWSQMTAEQKDTYGEDYYEAAMASAQRYSNQTMDLQPTLRVLIDAVTRSFPMDRYTPVPPHEKLRIFLAEHLATSLYNIIFDSSKI